MSVSSHHPSSFGALFETHSITTPNNHGNLSAGLPPATRLNEWRFRPGAYTPREFIREIAILLESVIVQLGPDGPGDADSRAILMDGLRSSLSHEGREATLPLVDWNSENPSDLTKHILRIGRTLLGYATESNYSVAGDPALTVYSPCEGHKWVPPAGRLLRSDRSSPILMMLYNEWLHQITCLRDNLIVFENFEEVVLNLFDTSRRGTRPMEPFRQAFLSHVSRGELSLESLVETAKILTAPGLGAGGYGFQYNTGVVLPAKLFSESRTNLLRYIPARLTCIEPGQKLFEPSGPAWIAGGKIDIGSLKSSPVSEVPWQASITASAAALNDGLKTRSWLLKLTATSESSIAFSIDLGDIIHGLEVASSVSPSEERDLLARGYDTYEASEMLQAGASVVTNSYTNPVIVQARTSIEVMTLLGKLDPKGVYLAGQWATYAASRSPLKSGETGSIRFLIVDEGHS